MEYNIAILMLAGLVGFIMTWGVGANDLANIMSTTMGSKAITVRQAMIIAVIFEFAGAVLGGGHVTQTIRSGIINTDLLANQPLLLMEGMFSTLLAGATWMLLASYIGMPVSITNAIVGAMVGFGVLVLGVHTVHWHTISKIAISWVCSPVIAGLIGFLLFSLIKRTIFDADYPGFTARRHLSVYFFLVGLVLGDMTVVKGLKHFNVQLSPMMTILIMLMTAFVVIIIGHSLVPKDGQVKQMKRYQQIAYVEKLFGILMGFTACAMVFAHGSNDVAIAMGPVSAIVSLVKQGKIVDQPSNWILWFGCVGVVIGLFMYGRKVIATVGSEITTLTPSRAFAATLSGAATVIVSTSLGIPVSATQTLVGGVFGVGLARGIGALNLRVIRNILLSWFITVPVAALLDIMFFYLIRYFFGG